MMPVMDLKIAQTSVTIARKPVIDPEAVVTPGIFVQRVVRIPAGAPSEAQTVGR
ncbi:MAG TPA: hypothetical protein VKU81_10950 [Casimicrobiaceae bacterium]|nr:hypothetical protein [Casimicrobiaceae bacterium]